MSAPWATPEPSFGPHDQAYWLPPHGFSNGLTASAWAEIADLTEEELPKVLFALTDARIAAYVATVRPRPMEPARETTKLTYRLWVDTLRYRSAEDILMEVLRGR